MRLRIPDIIHTFICLLVAAALWGCSDHSGSDPTGLEEGRLELRMDIKLVSGGTPEAPRSYSRADGVGFSDPVSPEETFQHLRVIIVEKSSGVIVHNRGIVLDGAVSLYDDMSFEVNHSTDYIIYLLANCMGISSMGKNLDFGLDALPVGSVYPADYIENAEIGCAVRAAMIDNTGTLKTGIPMAEKYEVTTVAPNGDEHQFQTVSFDMKRAAVKFSFTIEPSDNFVGVQTEKLTGIRVYGLSNQMYLLPRDAEESAGADVSFSVPASAERYDYDFTIPGGGFSISAGVESKEFAPLVYFPESLSPATGFQCSLIFDNGTSVLTPIVLPNLPEGLPRNTHVKVGIKIGNNNSVRLTVDVLPWNQVVSIFDYTNEVGIATDGALRFIENTYYNLDFHTGRLVLLNGTAAMGSFGVASPQGARWDAYLISQSGKSDAIQFHLPDDSHDTRISGTVDESIDNFKIEAVYPPGDKANTAILQVVVTTDDGRCIPINILTGAGYDPDVQHLTVIQNPK